MKNFLILLAATFILFLSACHRPVAYFQRTPHPAATRLPVEREIVSKDVAPDTTAEEVEEPIAALEADVVPVVASVSKVLHQSTQHRLVQRMQRVQSMLPAPEKTADDKQPEPKNKKKLKLGNRIRQSLGMPLRKELNWWQRISWKLKASVIIILVAVVFAILHITTLAIIFGIIGAFLMISGLKRSFKVKRPWF
ncbi:hypothetical protein IC229_09470 [Spirosoma sp. BT702]|uniref:Uncharacterized protein n=1 Tax=Spirosoma profusum TaxID=2771354 RepID=A0A926XV17_9BACT|nr:hypothetical protein [Spirosoma profusum]MBD2700867.1 hypothetical protein [Spirosoma profusum]